MNTEKAESIKTFLMSFVVSGAISLLLLGFLQSMLLRQYQASAVNSAVIPANHIASLHVDGEVIDLTRPAPSADSVACGCPSCCLAAL